MEASPESARPPRVHLLPFFGPALVLVAFAALALVAVERARDWADEVARLHHAEVHLARLMDVLRDAETAQRGYVITGDEGYLEPALGRWEGSRAALDSLEAQLADPVQRRRLAELRPLVDARLAMVDSTIAVRRARGFAAAQALLATGTGKARMDEVRRRAAAIGDGLAAHLARREAEEARIRRLMRLLLGLGTLASAASVVGTVLYLSRTARAAAASAREIAAQNARLAQQADDLESLAIELEEQASALREEEERWRALLEHSQDIVTVLSAEGRVQYATPALETILGHPPRELVGTDIFDLVHPEDRPGLLSVFTRLLEEPARTVHAEYRFRHRDGSWRHLESVGTNLLEVAPIRGVVANSRDLSERRATEETLRRTELQFQHAQKMEAVGRLAGGVAHDFNNVLTAIRGTVQLLLLDDAPGPEWREDLGVIDRAASRAADLTRQLLAFSRKQPNQPRVVDLNAAVRGMRTLLERLSGEDVSLRFGLREGLAPVLVDPVQLEQVLLNLAANARDAMPRGGTLTILTEMETRRSGAARVLLRVADTGEGMDEATKVRIFEPFFTTKDPGRGTGLGLSTVYGIVDQAGGAIWADSAPGHGACFTIALPAADPAAIEAERQIDASAAPRGRETVLVAEDDPATRATVVRAVSRLGYTVLEAANGAAALDLLGTYGKPVHLLLTDLGMPGIDGRELARRARERMPALRVLYSSGHVARAPGEEPPQPFVAKPFDLAALARALRAALDA